MKKNLKKLSVALATFCGVILAMAVIFNACKKDEDKAPAAKKNIELTCINEGFDPNGTYTTRGNGEDGWNQVQDFIPGANHTTYNFWLENAAGETFVSFCGNYGSSGIGEVAGVSHLETAQHDDIVGILNYINNEYGSLDAWSGYYGTVSNTDPAANTKLIAQYSIWNILGQVVTCGVPAIDDAVEEVLANGKTATGNINIYFMVGAEYPYDIDGIQPQIVPFCEPEITLFCVDEGFDWNAQYIHGLWYKPYGNTEILNLGLNSDILNSGGQIMHLYVTKQGSTPVTPGDYTIPAGSFASYCAHAGSRNFSQNHYVANSYENDELLAAFNYIYKKHGGTAKMAGEMTRVLSQIVVWNMYCGVDINVMKANLPQLYLTAINDVYANYKGATGDITSFALLTDPTCHDPNFIECQPQLVPLCEGDDCTLWLNRHVLFSYYYAEEDGDETTWDDFDGEFMNLFGADGHFNGGFQDIEDFFHSGDAGNPHFGRNHFGTLTTAERNAIEYEFVKFFCNEHLYCVKAISNCNAKSNAYIYIVEHKDELVGFFGQAIYDSIKNGLYYDRCLGESYGSVTATQKGNVPNIIASLNPKNGNPQDPQSFNAGVVYGSNHFCYATFTKAELEAGVKLDFVVGNKFQIVGTGSAKIVGGNIEVTIDNFGKGSFGVMAFNQNMVTKKFPKNGNIHSQKEADLKKELGATTGFNHDNKLVVPCPAGNTIYLYIHCGSVQFFL